MYIYALDTPLSRTSLPAHLRDQAIAYGSAMLKAALLLGWSPIISENQLIDSSTVLHLASECDDFVKLIEKDKIRMSTWSNVGSYRLALIGFLEKNSWITSAWKNANRNDLKCFLNQGGPMTDSNWEPDIKKIYNGLLTIDSLRNDNKSIVPAKKSTIPFFTHISNFYDSLSEYSPKHLKKEAENVTLILRDVKSYLSPEKYNDRSAWLTILLSEIFIENHEDKIGGGVLETAFLAVINSYNEILCESVANGIGFRSTPYAYTDTNNENVVSELLNLNNENFFSPNENDSNKGIAGVPICTYLPSKQEKGLKVLENIPWATVSKIVNDRKFRQYVEDAKCNQEARKCFLKWISDKVGMEVAQEYDAENKPTIKIGSRVIVGAIFPKLILLEVLLHLFGSKTFSEFIGKQLRVLIDKEITWRVNSSVQNALSGVVTKDMS